jgi:N-formylglutamate amidohydrolase
MENRPGPSDPQPPFRRIGPEMPAGPVILSVPHAGTDYSPALLKASRLPRHLLEGLEDPLVDRLVWRAAAEGATTLVARAPRAEIDLNRDERELDPSAMIPSPSTAGLMQSPRTRGGLGLIPSRIAGAGSIWRQRLPAAEVARRVEDVHRPYHSALATLLAKVRARFGIAVLLDCHSMPPRAKEDGPPIILGDRYGESIAPHLVEAALGAIRNAGFEAAMNAPYSGGHVTQRHGRPKDGIHALQIELDRSLYLAPDLRSPGPGFDRISELIAAVVSAVSAAALGEPLAIAAE